jgi:hypothetical protein
VTKYHFGTWYPIETAPVQTRILVRYEGDNEWAIDWFTGTSPEDNELLGFDAWMPLPPTDGPTELDRLREENARLREAIEQIDRVMGDQPSGSIADEIATEVWAITNKVKS